MSGKATAHRDGAVSFESRIAAVALATAVAVLIAASATFILQQWRAERVINERAYVALTKMLSAEAQAPLVSGDPNEMGRLFAALPSLPRVSSAELFDGRGKIVATYHRSQQIKMAVGRVD